MCRISPSLKIFLYMCSMCTGCIIYLKKSMCYVIFKHILLKSHEIQISWSFLDLLTRTFGKKYETHYLKTQGRADMTFCTTPLHIYLIIFWKRIEVACWTGRVCITCFMEWYVDIMYRWGSGREWYGAISDWGPLAEDSATKLKRGQLNVCTVYGVLFSPCGWNLCQVGRQFRSVFDNSKVQGIWFGLDECLIFHS